MGIRIKEEIRQCLAINTLPKEAKKQRSEAITSEITRIKSKELSAKSDKVIIEYNIGERECKKCGICDISKVYRMGR